MFLQVKVDKSTCNVNYVTKAIGMYFNAKMQNITTCIIKIFHFYIYYHFF